jgi:hypothetical protein
VPYLHCPGCRLTIYKPRHLVRPSERCPRCDALLSRKPARLFSARPSSPATGDKATRPVAQRSPADPQTRHIRGNYRGRLHARRATANAALGGHGRRGATAVSARRHHPLRQARRDHSGHHPGAAIEPLALARTDGAAIAPAGTAGTDWTTGGSPVPGASIPNGNRYRTGTTWPRHRAAAPGSK